MKEIYEKIKEEVNYCIDVFANHIDLDIEKRPKIEISEKMNSSHVPHLNLIRISINDVDKGYIYFEEVGHFLRDTIFPVTKFKANQLCDEFLGRLSEGIGKELLKNTKYRYLYEQYQPRNWSNLDEFMKAVPTFAAATVADIKRDQIKDGIILNSVAYTEKTMTPYVGELERIFTKYDEDHDEIMMAKEVNDAFDMYISNHKENEEIIKKGIMPGFLDLHSLFIQLVEQMNKNVGYLLEAKKAYKDPQNDKEKVEAEQSVVEFHEVIKKNYGSLEKVVLKTIDIAESNKKINDMKGAPAKLAIANVYSHLLGYVAAELYIEENPDFMEKAPELFRKPKGYINKELVLEADYAKKHMEIVKNFLKFFNDK